MPEPDLFWTAGKTLLAAGIGAFVANFAAECIKWLVRKSQAEEAARDEDLAMLLKMVDELQALGTTYWMASAKKLATQEPLLRAQIVARQQHALELIAHLFSEKPKRECDVLFTKVMDAVGGGTFGDPEREASPQRLSSVFRYALSFQYLAKRCRRDLRRRFLG